MRRQNHCKAQTKFWYKKTEEKKKEVGGDLAHQELESDRALD